MKAKINALPVGAVITAVFLFYAITGCKKNNADNAGPQGISATVGTVSFKGAASGNIYYSALHKFYLYSLMPAANQDTLNLDINFTSTHPLNSPIEVTPSDEARFDYSDLNGDLDFSCDPHTHTPGTITVTSWDSVNHTITGTFSGLMISKDEDDSLAVSNGRFNTTYSTIP